MYSDSELVAQAKAGSEMAFRELMKRHEMLVRSTVAGMLGNGPDVEDVSQEVFIRFYRSLTDFRGESQLSTYLCRIAINLSINNLKSRQRRHRWLAILRSDDPRSTDIPDHSEDPARRDTREWVHKAIATLEPEFRSVIVLRMIDGYSVRETAEILQVPEGTVASRLARAQKKLLQIFENWNLLT